MRSLTTGTDENLYSLANDKQFLCTLHICGTYTFRISMSFWITKKVINTNVTNVLIELFNIKVLKKACGLSVGFIDNRNDHMTPGV